MEARGRWDRSKDMLTVEMADPNQSPEPHDRPWLLLGVWNVAVGNTLGRKTGHH